MIETLADVGGSNQRGCDPICVGVSDKRSEIRSMGPGPQNTLGTCYQATMHTRITIGFKGCIRMTHHHPIEIQLSTK